MRQVFVTILSASIFLSICSSSATPASKDDKVKMSYSIGYQAGGDLKRQGVEINPESLLKGVQDAMTDNAPLLSRQDMRDILADLQKKISRTQEEKVKLTAEKNLAEGNAFLAENRKKKGVKVLPSGLQYKVLTEGSGKKPQTNGTVTVHYRGTLIDGTEFENSYNRGKPATFRAEHVIAGWKEALPMMKEGAKWQLFVPSQLGYGERSTGRIGPNSVLIFEIELISVQEKA